MNQLSDLLYTKLSQQSLTDRAAARWGCQTNLTGASGRPTLGEFSLHLKYIFIDPKPLLKCVCR